MVKTHAQSAYRQRLRKSLSNGRRNWVLSRKTETRFVNRKNSAVKKLGSLSWREREAEMLFLRAKARLLGEAWRFCVHGWKWVWVIPVWDEQMLGWEGGANYLWMRICSSRGDSEKCLKDTERRMEVVRAYTKRKEAGLPNVLNEENGIVREVKCSILRTRYSCIELLDKPLLESSCLVWELWKKLENEVRFYPNEWSFIYLKDSRKRLSARQKSVCPVSWTVPYDLLN